MGKSYVKITNATRQYLWGDSGLCKAHIETDKEYRHGEIGLLHPDIVEFYSDLENNMMRASKGKVSELFGKMTDAYMKLPPSRKWRGDEPLFYQCDKRDTPILMYDTRMDGNKGYFIVTLRKGEFEIIPNPRIEMPYLEAFDILMKGKIFEIPIEVAERKIEIERAKSLERYLRELKEIDLRRARSQSQMYRPVGT